MIKKIVRDQMFLSLKATLATKKDLDIANDLSDTINVHDNCIGMAANMIGINKRIIIIKLGMMKMIMFNPVLINKAYPYETYEGCLSLDGVRKTVRYKNIEVEYYDAKWHKQKIKLSGLLAQICLHEMDHLEGIII
ncbi:MAG: peptide deformylase [Firmicutes bacterium]|nr:peptide deformylase [Bacillota bacterium]